MNERDLPDQLARYADGELEAAARPSVEAHVGANPEALAEVARWQALRRCCLRVTQRDCCPAGLADRLRGRIALAAVAARARRIRLFAGSALGLAAAILLAVLVTQNTDWIYRGPGSGSQANQAMLVMPDAFKGIFDNCALRHHHDLLELAGKSIRDVDVEVSKEVKHAVHLPDLSDRGYRLAGGCPCTPCKSLAAVHAHYVRDDGATAVLSFFVLERPIRLGGCLPAAGCEQRRAAPRQFEIAAMEGDFVVIKWDECNISYAICARMPREDLIALADSLDVAVAVDPSLPLTDCGK
ncbi:hypothetical protein RAS1_22340 [Phycisphaerae bacterium RAS1]|nr:hypothetical protein RAS1_22340 [Phycisphaerae bacterium RAS1]